MRLENSFPRSKGKLPDRTLAIEIWENQALGTDGWKNQLGQFLALMASRGRDVPPYRFGNTNLPLNVLSNDLGYRLAKLVDQKDSHHAMQTFTQWSNESLLLRGEAKSNSPNPTSGVSLLHYSSLAFRQSRYLRDRYWANFWYWALHSELSQVDSSGKPFKTNAAARLDQFLSRHLGKLSLDSAGRALNWSPPPLGDLVVDTETKLIVNTLVSPVEGNKESFFNTSFKDGIEGFRRGKLSLAWGRPEHPAKTVDIEPEFTCTGALVLMKRSLNIQLEAMNASEWNLSTQDDVETTLSSHASDYYLRSQYMINELRSSGKLPAKCIECREKFGPGIKDANLAETAAGTAENAKWIDENCEFGAIYANVGPKEHSSAKTLAVHSLSEIYDQSYLFTANRIVLAIAVALECEISGKKYPEESLGGVDAEQALKAHFEDPKLVALANHSIKELINDILQSETDIDASARVELEKLLVNSSDPSELWDGVASAVEDLTLTRLSIKHDRLREFVNTLLGGGALPSNQDDKGRLRRGGGSNNIPAFHMAINERLLTHMAYVAFHEAKENSQSLTFNDLVEFIRKRFKIEVNPDPSYSSYGPGLVSQAADENIPALESRLANMGVLKKFSDSPNWNRISFR